MKKKHIIESGHNLIKNKFKFIQENNKVYPFSENLATQSVLFDPSRPGYLPPQGQLRPLINVGNIWRN